MARVLGITNKPNGATIPVVFQNIRKSSNVEIAEAKAIDGKVTDRAAISKTITITADGFVDAEDGVSIEAGELASYDGKPALISQAEHVQAAGQYQTMSVTLEVKDEAAVVPYGSTPE